MSRTTSRTSPAPDTTGRLPIENGPGGTVWRDTSALFTNTSTVDGSTAWPTTLCGAKVAKLGCVAKLVLN